MFFTSPYKQNLHIYIYTYIHMCIYIYIYISGGFRMRTHQKQHRFGSFQVRAELTETTGGEFRVYKGLGFRV